MRWMQNKNKLFTVSLPAATNDKIGKWAQVCWKGDWVAFLDSLLQTTVLTSFSKELTLPVEIEKIEIDPVKFLRYVAQKSEGKFPH